MSRYRKPPTFWYAWLKAVCLGLSVGDVWFAAFHNPKDGGMGGAVAAMLAFAALAVPEDLSSRLFRVMQMEDPTISKQRGAVDPKEERLSALEGKVSALEARFDQRDWETGRQSGVLGLCGLIGTVFWALGDRMAAAVHAWFA